MLCSEAFNFQLPFASKVFSLLWVFLLSKIRMMLGQNSMPGRKGKRGKRRDWETMERRFRFLVRSGGQCGQIWCIFRYTKLAPSVVKWLQSGYTAWYDIISVAGLQCNVVRSGDMMLWPHFFNWMAKILAVCPRSRSRRMMWIALEVECVMENSHHSVLLSIQAVTQVCFLCFPIARDANYYSLKNLY